ncbi:hypothetical protein, partial [Salmonella enterica]|uniref:hypothetical protein n=1 Tax=Salmonella enterica TaxID=28901 RepID=UPI00398C481E
MLMTPGGDGATASLYIATTTSPAVPAPCRTGSTSGLHATRPHPAITGHCRSLLAYTATHQARLPRT